VSRNALDLRLNFVVQYRKAGFTFVPWYEV